MKILITGSSGFIGSHMTPRLEKNFKLYHLKSDLLDFDNVVNEVNQIKPDIIVHLAARTEVEKSFYEQLSFSQVNYIGSVNLIEAASRLKNVYFVFASTMEVYGWQPISDEIRDGNIPNIIPAFDETTQANPNAPYAVAKYGVEKYLEYAQRAYGLDYAIIRQTNSYGRKDNNFFATEQIIWQMLTNPTECNLGYATPYRNFIFIDDLLDAWDIIISNRDKCANNIFTLGPDYAVQIKDHALTIASMLNWNGTINWDTKLKRPGEIYLLNSTGNKLKTLTGWEPKVSYNEGLLLTISYWQEIIKNGNI